jgi:hypothetical protein
MPGTTETTVRKRHEMRSVKRVAARDISVLGEAAYIVQRAVERDARVVSLGALLFFSTTTGDAWMLDPTGGVARCLAKGGEPLPPGIDETAESCSAERTTHYRIDGDVMEFAERSGGVRLVAGYPVAHIDRVTRRMLTTR